MSLSYFTLFILVDFPVHVNRISMELFILYFNMSQIESSKLWCFIIVNSEDPDEMPHYVAFHLSLYCLPMCLFTDIQNEKGKTIGCYHS